MPVLRRFLDASHSDEVHGNIGLITGVRWVGNTAIRFGPPFIAVIGRGLGVPLGTMGAAFSAGDLAGVVGPVIGRGVDGRARRRSMIVAQILLAAAALLAAISWNVVVFAVALVAISLSKMVYDQAMGAWVADRVDYELRTQVTGLTETSWAMSMIVGVPLLGLLTAVTSWRVAFGVLAAGCLVCGWALYQRLPSEVAVVRHTGDHNRIVMLLRASWPAYVGFAALMTASNALGVVFGAWFEDAFGFSTAAVAITITALGFAELLATVAAIRFTDRLGKRRAVISGAVAMLPVAVAIPFVGHQAVVGVALLSLFFLGFEFAIVSGIPLMSELHPEARASSMGIAIGLGTIGRGTATVVSTWLYERHGIGACALLGGAVTLVCITLLGFGVREPGTTPGT
jgi:predicted MFS family arabinose efflux permease